MRSLRSRGMTGVRHSVQVDPCTVSDGWDCQGCGRRWTPAGKLMDLRDRVPGLLRLSAGAACRTVIRLCDRCAFELAAMLMDQAQPDVPQVQA